MRLLGNLTFAGLGQIQNLRVENLAADPSTPSVGQVWYNTSTGFYKGFDGTDIITFASGGNTAVLQSEIDTTEASIGLNADGTFAPFVGTNYLDASTTIRGAELALDTQVKANAVAITAGASTASAIQSELDTVETAAGLNADGTFTAPVGTTYLGGATSLKNADTLLDTQVKSNFDATVTNALAITTKVASAGDLMTGNLAFGGLFGPTGLVSPTDVSDAATKGYVDSLISGLTWLPPVVDVVASRTAYASPLAKGDRLVDLTDNKIYTVTTAGATGSAATFGTGVSGNNGDALFAKSSEQGYVSNGTTWVQFTGTGMITDGVGLVKNGNVLSVNMGAGVAQLPTDEIGIDIFAAGALMLTTTGSDDSTDTSAQLSLRLDGASLSKSTTGVRVAAAGVTEVELSTSVAGGGLVGGAGSPLAVGAGTGIVVSADSVSLDTSFGDARYATLAGATFAGAVVLAADPVDALAAATKQYVDAVNTRLNNSTFVFTGSSASVSFVVNHGIGTKYCNVTVIDSADKVIIPDSITFNSASQLTVTFSSAITCTIVVTSKFVG